MKMQTKTTKFWLKVCRGSDYEVFVSILCNFFLFNRDHHTISELNQLIDTNTGQNCPAICLNIGSPYIHVFL